jgi:hypothetical protein
VLAAFYRCAAAPDCPIRGGALDIECFAGCTGGFAYVRYDSDRKSHDLVIAGSACPTGFLSAATSMAWDLPGNRIWIAGDFRVRPFRLDRADDPALLFFGDFAIGTRSLPKFHCPRAPDRARWRSPAFLEGRRRRRGRAVGFRRRVPPGGRRSE